MTQSIDFIFDFASPNAYLVHRALPALLKRTGADINYVPCLLGGIFKATGNQAPMMAFGGVKGKLDYDRLEIVRFIQNHNISAFKMNPNFPVNTLLLMRGAIVAQTDDKLEDYIEAGFVAMWERGLKMDEPEVFASAMAEAGFDGEKMLARTQDTSVKDRLMQNTNDAVARGCFGIPTFYIGDEMFFGKERLPQMEALLSQ
ncbi:MAG: 2-hydroxychromene-2-carboxylate isomerase [Pseudomonadota bacterium]